MKTKHPPLPYPFYFWQVAGYALIGLVTSLYLAYTHYKNHTDPTFSSFCAITQAVNCDTVAQSPWSIFGGVPIAIWGIFVYLFFLILLAPLRKLDDRLVTGWSMVTSLGLFAICCSVALAVLSFTRIHSWCILCIVTYAVNFLFTFTSWIIFRRFAQIGFFSALPSACKVLAHAAPIRVGLPLLIVLFLSVRFFLPSYWTQEMGAIDSKVATGTTNEGHPWIGAETPRLVIEEFTDYQCFQCKKMHFYLRQLINRYPDRIRLVHRHYPLDHEFNRIVAPTPLHVGSGRMALIAIVAAEHNAFWPVNDALYEAAQSKADTIEIDGFAQLMGISKEQLAKEMFAPKTLKHLQHDMVQGMQHGITGTPSFVVDGTMYQTTLPPELLREVFN